MALKLRTERTVGGVAAAASVVEADLLVAPRGVVWACGRALSRLLFEGGRNRALMACGASSLSCRSSSDSGRSRTRGVCVRQLPTYLCSISLPLIPPRLPAPPPPPPLILFL